MSNKRGPDLSEVAPKSANTGQIYAAGAATPFTVGGDRVLTAANYGLANGSIKTVTPLNSFRPGQQILFWLTIYNRDIDGLGAYISQVKLKPWWLRPNLEFRAAGDGGWRPIDEQTFSGGTEANNRRCWAPSQKIQSIGPFAPGPTPPASLAGHVDSYYLDDVWTIDLQDPADAAYAATPLAGQLGLWRQISFLYVAHGYALGFTCDATVTGGVQIEQNINFDLNWVNGTLG
jgi:hypothetical protein